jgi:hypothetical protein
VSHADEVITDVNTRRVMARAHDECFTIAWDYPGQTLLEVRILRSEQGPAASAHDGPELGQQIVYQDVTGSFRDADLLSDHAYHYAVFARHPGEEWVRWEEYSLPCEPRSGWRGFGRLVEKGAKTRLAPGPIVVCLLVLAAGLLVGPGMAGASSSDASSSGSGDDSSASTSKATTSADAAVAAAKAAVEADESIAAVLAGKDATVEDTAWGGATTKPAGYTLVYRWASASAIAIDEAWPLLRSGDSTPTTPYDTTTYRLRARDVSALRVDVLLDGSRVIQTMPVDGETDFTLEEQTWPPFSWVPEFTKRPWVLAPVFIAIAAIMMARAWRRSRAWNRRMPSMTRHDRQFIARVGLLVFLIAGFAWQFYEGWYAATGPSVGAAGSSAGALTSLPLLMIPPGLFVAGLVLELSAGSRRGAWALLAILAGGMSVFNLATAITGATTNLNLTYYVLLAVLALLSIPRAFSAGKMGWSRSSSLRYG